MPLRKYQTAIRVAARRLAAAEGRPVAMRNARAAMLKALRALRAAVDREYPAERRTAKRTRKRRTPEQRLRAMKADGWVAVVRVGVLARLADAGIKTITVTIHSTERGYNHANNHTMAPGWAVTIATHRPSKLAAARRSPTTRKALLTEIELLGG